MEGNTSLLKPCPGERQRFSCLTPPLPNPTDQRSPQMTLPVGDLKVKYVEEKMCKRYVEYWWYLPLYCGHSACTAVMWGFYCGVLRVFTAESNRSMSRTTAVVPGR